MVFKTSSHDQCQQPTWNCVVQDKAEEPSNEHVGSEEHHDDLIELLHTCKMRLLMNTSNHLLH